MYATAVESEAARSLSPAIAWPTLALFGLLTGVHAGLLTLALSGAVPPFWLTVPLGLVAYLSYTPAHEAIHRNIVRTRAFDPANRAIGWWSALTLGMSWPLLLRTHIAHHTHTNADGDPDLFVRGSLPRLFLLAALSVLTNLVPLPIWRAISGAKPPSLGYLDAWKVMPADDWRRHQIVHLTMCAAVWWAVAAGYGAAVFALYVLPATIGRLLMGVFLSWLPHWPHAATDRYQATRLRRGRLLALLSVGHHLHLVHHLWPRVPFYRYAALHRQLAPLLRERGVRLR